MIFSLSQWFQNINIRVCTMWNSGVCRIRPVKYINVSLSMCVFVFHPITHTHQHISTVSPDHWLLLMLIWCAAPHQTTLPHFHIHPAMLNNLIQAAKSKSKHQRAASSPEPPSPGTLPLRPGTPPAITANRLKQAWNLLTTAEMRKKRWRLKLAVKVSNIRKTLPCKQT